MIILLITFLAIFVQSTAGFGMALTSMPLFVDLLGIHVASPLVSLIGITSQFIMLLRYRRSLNIRAVVRLAGASLLGIPIGVFLLKRVDVDVITAVLGIIITGYAIYALLQLKLPLLTYPAWAYGFGFIGGILSGAFNTSGPSIVVYATCRRWSPSEFRGNIQGFFLLNSIMTMISHAISGNYTLFVFQNYFWALPGIALGFLVGFSLDKKINPEQFQKIVLILLIFLGIRLILWCGKSCNLPLLPAAILNLKHLSPTPPIESRCLIQKTCWSTLKR